MRALLIDDERLARAELRRLLEKQPEVEIAGEARHAEELPELDRELPVIFTAVFEASEPRIRVPNSGRLTHAAGTRERY